jgi:outer membrane protein insertion porin family
VIKFRWSPILIATLPLAIVQVAVVQGLAGAQLASSSVPRVEVESVEVESVEVESVEVEAEPLAELIFDAVPTSTIDTPPAQVAQTQVAQSEQETPGRLIITPDRPPTGQPTLVTPPPPVVPETTLPPSEIQLPASSATPVVPLAPGVKPIGPQATPPQATPPQATPPVSPNPDATKPEPRVLVAEVAIKGATSRELENTVYTAIRTKAGQTTTRTQLQEDINAVFATGFFANVQAAPEDTPLGVRVTFVVEPNPILKSVQIQGSKSIPAAEAEEIFRSQYGTTLNLRTLQQGVQALTKKYQEKGFVLAQIIDVPKISPDGVVTLEVAEGQVESIQINFINKDGSDKDAKGNPIKGRTRNFIVTREMETKPGGVFNRTIAERDLQRIFGLGIFDDVKLELNPGNDPRQVNVQVNVAERSSGSTTFGANYSGASGLFGSASYQLQNVGGNNQRLGAEVQVGQRELLFDASFNDPWIAGDPFRTSYNIDAFRRRSVSLVYDGGDEVRIQSGTNQDRPRVVRTGGGVTFTRPLSKDVFKRAEWVASAGLEYQQVKVQDGNGRTVLATAPQVNAAGVPVGLGRDLSFSGTGKDDLFTLQFGLVRDQRNNPLKPTSGSLFRIGTEQSIPIGAGSILYNRIQTSYSYYLPTRLLKLAPACRDQSSTLIPALAKPKEECAQAFAFNVKAGTVLGDLPPYEAFSLGGTNSVRGYEEGDVGSGKSFLQATAEYRFPVFSVVSGALFVDAATDFGTGSSVKGDPAGLRGKPGNGIGYGLGVRVQTPLGPIRVDYGFNDQGSGRLHFGLGERF